MRSFIVCTEGACIIVCTIAFQLYLFFDYYQTYWGYLTLSNLYSSFKVSDSVNAIYKPSIKNKMYGWQYTSSGIVNGINGACDVNIWYQNIEKKDDKELTNQTILRYGDSGENVKMMQQRLLAKNFKTCIIDGQKKKLVADGKFGPITKSILVRFKIYSGLSDEPICDAATWRNLF